MHIKNRDDMKEYIYQYRQSIVAFSSKVAHDIKNIQVTYKDGFCLEHSDLSLYENLILLLVRDNLSHDQVRKIIGYVCVIYFYSVAKDIKMPEGESKAVEEMFYKLCQFIFVSREDSEAYELAVQELEDRTIKHGVDFSSLVESPNKGLQSPYENIKPIDFKNMEMLIDTQNILIESQKFNHGLCFDIVAFPSKSVIATNMHNFSFNFPLGIALREGASSQVIENVKYRVCTILTTKGLVSTFRKMTSQIELK